MPDRLIPILKQTAQSQKKQPPTEGGAPGGLVDVYAWLNRAGALLAPWWSRARDKQLRYFWKQNDALASAMYTLNSKILSIPFHVEPRDISIRAHLKQAGEFEHNLWEMTGFGAGWIQGIAPILEDLFGQDNGMFIELIGEGPKDGPIVGPVLGVAHLDAAQCLGRDSRVLLADGTTVPIYRMVRDKHPGPIMSLGESGQLESKPVTGWHEVGLGERHWLRIGVEYSRHVFGRSEGLWVTDDHEILTPAGWTPAGRLSVGDMIATSFREPNEDQMTVIVGTLLGDGHLRRPKTVGTLSRLVLSQGDAQKEWLEFKKEFLRDLGWGISHKNVIRNSWGCESKASPIWTIMRESWYPNDKKIVAKYYTERYFGPRLWAVWYCDDGNLQRRKNSGSSVRLYTNSFSYEENIWLSQMFSKHGIECFVRGQGKYFYLYFPVDASKKFLELIAPYVPDNLRYKLPDNVPSFNPSLWNTSVSGIHFAEIIEISEGDNGGQIQSFCLDVKDNHNFVAGGMIVHNCIRTRSPEYPVIYYDLNGDRYKFHHTRIAYASQMPSSRADMNGVGFCACSRAINAAQNIYDIQVYKMEKLGSRPKRQILVGEKGLTANDIMMAMRTADEAMDNEGLTRASRTVVIAPKHVLPQTEVRLNQIDLASVPDGFDEQQSITTGVYILAWAFGVDAREFWPASATGATKADALLQHMKARGKAVGNTLTLFEKIINTYVLPAHLKFSFDVQDDDEDQQRADISATVSQTTERDVNAGLYDVRKARVEMVNAGHMTQQEFEDLELKDGRLEGGEDILSLFYSDDPLVAPLLKVGVKDPLDTEALYWEELQPAVNAQKRECLKVIAMQLNATTVAIRRAATKAKAALDALEKYWQQNGASYQEEQMAEEGEPPAEGEQPPAPEGEAPPATEETPPEEGKDMGDTVIRLKQPNVKVYVPRQRPPIVNVTVPQAPLDVEKFKDLVQAPPARIIVNVPPQAPPVVNVQVPVQPVDVHVDAKIEPTVEDIAVQRDHDGKITGMMKRVRANK